MGIKIWKVKVLEIYNTSILQKHHFLILFHQNVERANVLFSFPVQAITSHRKANEADNHSIWYACLNNKCLLRWCIRTSAYIGCEKTLTGAMGLRMRCILPSALGYFRSSSSLDWFSFDFSIED